MIKKFLMLSLLLNCFLATAQEKDRTAFIADSLQTYIETGMKDWNIPGLSVAIVKDDQIVFMKGFGVTDHTSKQPVDENTVFMIGSNTKAFTATALSILQDANVLSLNDKVQQWLPEFTLNNPLAAQEATIVDVLSHRIGFETFQGDFTFWMSNLTRAEIIQKMSLIEAPYGFREKWGYCNAGYVVAGEIIPRATGKSWSKMLQDSILTPLKMTRTQTLTHALDAIENTAKPHSFINYKLTETPFVNIDNLAPAGSMSSSANDMAKWLKVQLNNGKLDGEQVLNANSLQRIRTPKAILNIDARDKQETHFYLYALGLSVNDRDGKLVYSHTGGINGFLSSVMFIPEEQLGIVVLTNTDENYFFQNLTHEIRDAFLGLPYQDYSKSSLTEYKKGKAAEHAEMDALKRVVNQHHKTPFPLKEYAGMYVNSIYGSVEIKAEDSKLTMYFSNHPHMTATLDYLEDNTYLCTFSEPIFGVIKIPFKVKENVVEGFTLKVANHIERTPYKFVKQK